MKNKIYIISLSPSIDYILEFNELVKNKTNRPNHIEMYPAGKGIHIAMLLNNLDFESDSLIFTSGDFENYFYNGLDSIGINYKKFKSNGNIRINLKLIDDKQTECSVSSPAIEIEEINKMINYLKEQLKENDFVVVTGSLPTGVDPKIYSKIVKLANEVNAKCIVDAFGETLNYAIEEKPFLIKPNVDELSLTTGLNIQSEKDILIAGKTLLSKGVKNILISMGEKGAIFMNEKEAFKCEIWNWNKKIVNAAGAGDSMIGGFLKEFIETNDFRKSLKKAIICGSATAYSIRIAEKSLIEELSLDFENLNIQDLN